MTEHNGVSWACSIFTTLTGLISTNEVFQIVLTLQSFICWRHIFRYILNLGERYKYDKSN